MTESEKAKAYDEAINAIMELKAKHPTARVIKDWIKENFPELAESENERIRKALCEFVHDTTGDSLWVDYNIYKEDALAWLEKQGQTFTKKDVDDAYLKGVCDTKQELEKQGEQKAIDDLTQQEAMDIAVAKCFEQGEKKSADIDNKFLRIRETKPNDISEFLDRLTTVEQEFLWEHIAKIRELDKEEQKSAWSEEDETVLTNTIIMLKEGASLHFNKKDITKAVDGLKDLKERCIPQPKTEWSEEEKEKINSICNIVADKRNLQKQDYKSYYNSLIDFLKSLCPQKQCPHYNNGQCEVGKSKGV